MSPRKKNNVTVFAKKLIELRKARHLTQAELSEKIGISRSVIGYYEANAKNPTIDTLQKFADFFGVPVTDLLEEQTGSGHPGRASILEKQLKRIQNLSPARQRMISKTLDALIEG